ncbi:MAG: rhodanese-like domain-containing protein [Longimicrobiales bacterium]
MTWWALTRNTSILTVLTLAFVGLGMAGARGSGPDLSGGESTARQDWSLEQAEVWNTVQELWRLSTALDLDAWFGKVSEDYRGWSITEETPRGKATWRVQAQARFSGPRRVHHQLVPRAVDVHGNMAIAYYHYAAVTRTEEGAFSTSRGQWTDVFRLEGSEWKLLADAGGETESSPEILVSTEWLAQRLEDPDLVVIQVESQEERYVEGHIPGALYLPYDRIVWDGANGEGAEFLSFSEIESALEGLGLENEHHVVVYGSHPLIAARLWLTLDILGVGERRSLLDGGLPAWTEEGRPLSTETPETPPLGSLTPRPAREKVVDASWLLANLEDPGLALVDARYAEEYTGEGQETEQVGHIPGAGNAPWVDMVESREVFRLRPVEDLAAAFHGAGADPGETVVPYCIIGLRASLDYFVARLLGYETRFYDGSWRDWTNRGLPLVEGGSPR